MKIFRELKLFFCINFLLVSLLLLVGYINSTATTNKVGEKYNLNYSNKICKLSEGTFEGLEDVVLESSKDKNIIKLINSSANYKDKEKNILTCLRYTKGLLTATSFAESIDVVDAKSNQLYSSKGYHKDYNMKKRPWYPEALKESEEGKEIILTQLHKDYFNDRYTISIISFIKDSKNQNIGCIILNTYMDTYTKYLSELYGNDGAVKIYVKIKDDKYYEYEEGIQSLNEIKSKKNIFVVSKEGMLFVFNKNKSIMSETISKINNINIFMLVIFFVLTIVFFIIVKRKILKLLFASIHKLKNILKQLNRYDEKELDGKDGFEQLNFIVNSFDLAINEKTREYMLYDSLTGMLNRRGLEETYKREVLKNRCFALIFIDLNKFKNINDVYGHLTGDEYLKDFSKKLYNAIEKRGVLARVAGDEFIILLRNFVSKEELGDYFNRKVVNLFKKEKLVDNKFVVSFSAGASIYPLDGKSLSELIKKSDYMMYLNKKKGRKNQLSFLNKTVFKELEKEEQISINIGAAIKKNELEVKYQPIVDQDKNIVKLEALLRWNSEKFGLVPPDRFIRIAEENGEIIKIGYWVINKVCKDINKLKENDINDLVININVSAIQLLEMSFSKNVRGILTRNKVKCENICIEITESVVLEEDEVSLNNLELLNSYGIKISLDDFGTGYTSFSYLKKFRGQSLKIDKTILDNAAADKYHIINSIKEIGEELDFDIVIEGVETVEQFKELCKINCKFFQGFYFSKPVAIDKIIEIFK